MSLKMKLSNGQTLILKITLEEFEETALDEDGNFKVSILENTLTNMKGNPKMLIFTNHIVSVEEIKD